MKAYPLVFEPILREKVWGGRRLERLGKPLPEGATVGESWELADLDETAPEGGGGGRAQSVIANGEMRGMTIREAERALGVNMMGECRLTEWGGFPLLVKYLDARENLSVQVHPSAEYAAAHPGAHLKTESWYVVEADPGAVIYKGLKAGVSREELRRRVEAGTVEEAMARIEVRAGDFHHLPSGTCHALGAGVLVAEVQTPSDTTFRVFDWGRSGRTLHVEQAMECIRFGGDDATPAVRASDRESGVLERNEHYEVRERRMAAGSETSLAGDGRAPIVWMCISGSGRIASEEDAFEDVAFDAGTTMLLPAGLGRGTARFDRDTVLVATRLVRV